MTERDFKISPLTVDEYDRLAQQHSFDMEKQQASLVSAEKISRDKVKVRRWETMQNIGIAVVVAFVVCGIAFGIIKATSGPSNGPSGDQIEQQRETTCINAGGGWVPKNLLADTANDHGLCVFPKTGSK